MKILSILLLFSICFDIVQAETNSAPLKFRILQKITFYLGFNQETVDAEMASGDNKSLRKLKEQSFESGVKVKALLSGDKMLSLFYKLSKNLSFERSGSISMWIKPIKWKRPKDMPVVNKKGERKRIYRSFFSVSGKKNKHLCVQRMSSHSAHPSFNKDYIMLYARNFKGGGGQKTTRVEWPDQKWQNLVLTWDPLNIKMYINGKFAGSINLKEVIADSDFLGQFRINCPEHTMIDEVCIYDYALSDKIIKEFYDYYKSMNVISVVDKQAKK